jgi:ATP-binding cassette subfamily C protein
MRLFGIDLPRLLGDAARACREHVRLALALSALVNLLYLAPTIYMIQVYDRVVPTGGLITLGWLTLVIAVALLVLAFLDQLRSRVLLRAGLRLNRLLAPVLLDQSLKAPRGAQARSLREFDTVRNALAGQPLIALLDIPWTPVYILVATLLHPLLGLVILLGAMALVIVAVLNERQTREATRHAYQALSASYAEQERMAAAGETISALGMRRPLVARLAGQRAEGLALASSHQFAGSRYTSLARFLRLFLQSAALGVGAWLAVEGLISIGAIIAASVLMGRALQPMEALVGQWKSLVEAREALVNLSATFADLPASPPHRFELPPPLGRLEARGLTVLAPGAPRPLLLQLSFDVAPGEFIGVIGPSGAGKSTLMRALAGAIPADHGEIRFDGSHIADWEQERLARYLGYLPQDGCLLPGTVAENVSRFAVAGGADPAATDAMVLRAAEAAGAHAMVAALPGGYEARIGWNGQGLSAGQRQRIALARALYSDPAILLFDEPDTALDAEGEAALKGAVAAARKRGATILLATHRTALLADADRLLVLVGGRMQMFGPADEVRARLAGKATPPRLRDVAAEGVPARDLGAA